VDPAFVAQRACGGEHGLPHQHAAEHDFARPLGRAPDPLIASRLDADERIRDSFLIHRARQ
jgi:hypothetical protein